MTSRAHRFLPSFSAAGPFIAIAALAATAPGCVLPEYSYGSGGTSSSGAGTTSSATGAAGATSTTGGTSSGGTGGTGATGGTSSGGTGGTGATGGTGGTGGTTSSGGTMCDSGGTCETTAPVGWSFVRTHEAASGGGNAPSCPAGGAPVTLFTDPAPSACEACSCKWIGATCTEGVVGFYDSSPTCNGTPTLVSPLGPACMGTGDLPQTMNGMASFQFMEKPHVDAQGMCLSQPPKQTHIDPWLTEVHVCAAPLLANAACPSGECVSGGNAGYTGAPCVQKAGDQLCPGDWPAKTLAYAAANDQRACNACGCAMPMTTCGINPLFTIFDGDGCAASSTTFGFGECADVSFYVSDGKFSLKPPAIVPDTTYVCGGGNPAGKVIPSDPTTICCKAP